MILPLGLLFGLLLIAAEGALGGGLPSDPPLWRVLALAPLLLAPAAWALFALPRLVTSRRGAARLGGLLVLASYAAFAIGTELVVFGALASDGSRTLEFAIVAGPLFASELLLRLAEERTLGRLAHSDLERFYLPPIGHARLPMVGFLATTFLICTVVVDLVCQRRKLAAFFTETSLGMTLGGGLLVALFVVLLPLMFRAFLPIRALPENGATAVAREAAARLGFPQGALKLLQTGHREINAALIGPLPWPRYLVLSDGLVDLFRHDPLSLRGVVAHEIGHARAHHPAWLVVCVAVLPLLWIAPLERLVPGDAWPWWLWCLVPAVLIALAYALHRIAHRFEHEADQISAEVLGGAQACVTALRRVGELYGHRTPKRASLRHPSEDARVAVMLQNESDPVARERFWRAGRLLRSVLVACVLVSIGFAAHSHAKAWNLDRVRSTFAEGRLPAAERLLAALDPLRLEERDREEYDNLRKLVIAARQVVPEGGPWLEIRERLAAAGRTYGDEILARGHGVREASEADPWLRLAVMIPAPSARARTLHAWCRAKLEARDGDAERFWEHARHLP